MPSVRGRQRIVVHAALTAGALASAALGGFVVGILGQGSATVLNRLGVMEGPPSRSSVVLVIVGVALALDAAHLSTGGLAPITLGRQVPREWGRLLPPHVTAVLYGARLGVGPLTILSTWTWWAVLIAASTIGVWTTVAVSAWFALARVTVNAAAAQIPTSASLAESLIRIKRSGWGALTTSGVALLTIVALSGCSLGESAARPALLDSTPDSTIGSAEGDTLSPWTTTPAQLEDFVRTSTPTGDTLETSSTSNASSKIDEGTAHDQPLTQHSLAQLLPTSLTGMSLVDDPSVDRFLTVDAAAAIQPDPTEEIALLETRGYKGGWIRAFRSPSSDVAVAAVYEFRDEAEAEFYLEDGLITIGGYGGQFFDVPDLPNIRGFQQLSEDDGQQTLVLGGAFFHQNRWHLLYLVGAPATVTAENLVPALQAYYYSAVGETLLAPGSN